MDDSAKVLQVMKLQREEAKAHRLVVWNSLLAPLYTIGCVSMGYLAGKALEAGRTMVALFLLVVTVGIGILVVIVAADAIDTVKQKYAIGGRIDILLGIKTEQDAENDTEKRPIDSSAE